MRDFFKGWRRTAGVVTLVMALVLMSGWIRSLVSTDGVLIWVGSDTQRELVAIAIRQQPSRLNQAQLSDSIEIH